MLNIKKILLPVDFPITSLDVIHQAAMLAGHFHSEIVMLHVVTALSHSAGVPEDDRESPDWDLLTEIIKEARKQQVQSLSAELDGLTIRRMLVKGDPAWAIVKMAEEEKADLIVMPSHGATAERFCWAQWQQKCSQGPGARFGPARTWNNRQSRSLRSATSCAPWIWARVVMKLCHGPPH